MPDRRYIYRVELDQGSAANSARQLKQVFQREISNLQVNPRVSTGGRSAASSGSSGFQLGGELLPGYSSLTRALGTTIGGFAIGATAVQIGRTLLEMDRQAASYRRINVAALELAGSQEKLNHLMEGYQQVTGGAVDKATALADITRLQALGFADTRAEMERFLTAARGASLATGNSIDYITQQLQLAIANQSTMRLDQLGLGVSEVKDRIDTLRESMRGASEETIYQEAVLGLLEEKYGRLVRSAEAAATGQELLSKAIKDLRLEVAQQTSGFLDDYLAELAILLGAEAPAAQLVDILRTEQARFAKAAQRVPDYMDNTLDLPDWLGGDVQIPEWLVLTNEGLERTAEGMGILIDLWERLNAATEDGAKVMPGYEEALRAAMQAAVKEGYITVELMEQILSLLRQFDKMVGDFDVRPFGPPTKEQFEARQTPPEPVPGGFGMFSLFGTPGDYTKGIRFLQANANEEAQRRRREADAEAARSAAKAARDAEMAWRKAAQEVEQALRDAAQQFRADLESIPGLFGTSPITQDQIDMAELGVPQNFADNYLRRLTDEVLNGVDWEGVDIRDAARRAGIDQSLDPKAILAIFTDMWKDSSLFANPANLDLLDRDAIQAGLRRAADARRGRENLLAMFGLTPEGEYKEAEEMGRILGIRVIEGAAAVVPETSPQVTAAVKTYLTDDAAVKQYASAGTVLADEVYGAFANRAAELDWAGAILGQLYRGIQEELDPAGALN